MYIVHNIMFMIIIFCYNLQLNILNEIKLGFCNICKLNITAKIDNSAFDNIVRELNYKDF